MPDDVTARDTQSSTLGLAMRVIVICGGIPASLALTAINSVLPKIDSALAHTTIDHLFVKQLVGVVGFAMLIGAPLSGWLVNRVGVPRMLLAASLIYVLGGTAGLYASALPMLLLSRFLLGLSGSAILVTALTLINTRLEGATRAKWMGLHISISMLSTVVTQPIAGLLGEISWRMPFLLYFIGLVFIPATLAIRSGDAAVSQSPRRSESGDGIWSWFPLWYLPLALCIGTVMFLPAVYAPFVLRHIGVESPAIISFVMTADSIAGAITAMLYGRFRRRHSAKTGFCVSFLSTMTGALVVGLSHNFVGVFAGLMIFGIGSGWMVPNMLTSLAERLGPEKQGRAIGLLKAFHFLASPLSVFIAEPLTWHFGQSGAILFAAFLSALLFTAICLSGTSLTSPGRPSPA